MAGNFVQKGYSQSVMNDLLKANSPYIVDRRPPHHVLINKPGTMMKNEYWEPYWGEVKNGLAKGYNPSGIYGVPKMAQEDKVVNKLQDISPDAAMMGEKEIKIVTASEPKQGKKEMTPSSKKETVSKPKKKVEIVKEKTFEELKREAMTSKEEDSE